MSKKFEFPYKIRLRAQRGSISVVALILAFFVILPLAFLGFEMSRLFLIQSELQHVLDAAALSGTAALASSPTGFTVAQQRQQAMQTAVNNFCQNSILQTSFVPGTNLSYNLNTAPDNTNPALHSAIINVTLYNQAGVAQPTDSQTATVMKIAAAYTDQPMFLKQAASLIPSIQSLFTVRAYSTGGLPQLDLALCFDVSGSMDDETPVHFVRRYWDGSIRAVNYLDVTGANLTGDPGLTIYSLTYPPPTGTSLNATWPQNLSYASYPNPGHYNNPYVFSEGYYTGGTNPLIGLRSLASAPAGSACPEQGRPPGNYQASNPALTNGNGINPSALSTGFTDMVVLTAGFPTYQVAVEASRGNLASASILSTSMGGTTTSNTVSPKLTGYSISPTCYNDYWTAVNNAAEPISDAKTAAVNFFNLMNTSANAHFMLETFSTSAPALATGGSPTSTYVDPTNTSSEKTDVGYAAGGTSSFPLPLVPLNQTQSQLTPCINAVSTGGGGVNTGLIAEGKTDIADALQEAYSELTNSALYRPTAKRAIILFTDGIPNMPASDPNTPAQNIARACNTAGIPIYTIGLSTNSQVVAQEATFLGQTASPGLAFLSGNKATYTPVATSTALNNAFQQIARSLVVLQQ
ncbi:MAG: VWA domain-containing protein [Candidatus Obscuribacterales bacterium]|nr:VWA domain-containing protein [Candidatus Obscuribacterales bacterium]